MSQEIIGYRFHADGWDPIYPLRQGMVATAAIMSCQGCGRTIKPSGGPGWNCVCLECFNTFKLVNFTQGNEPL